MLLNQTKIKYLKFIYLIYLLLAILVGIYPGLSVEPGISVYQVGVAFGSIGISLIGLQLLFSSRLPELEKGVGLDRIMKWHSVNARLAVFALFLHPIFLFYNQALASSISSILRSFTIYHWMGVGALLLVFLTIALAVYSDRLKINYELWKVLHRTAYLIIVLGFVHSRFISTDFATRGLFYYWWFIVLGIALFGISYRYLIRPWRIRNNIYKVTSVKRVAHKIHTIVLEPVSGNIIKYFPGQFAFVKFKSARLPNEEHHFTLSSSPKENNLAFTVKDSGDFTSRIGLLRKGDKAIIDGPFGAFSNYGMKGPFLFIAGGIGITPVFSMVKYMKQSRNKEKSALVYSASSYKDLAFFNELNEVARSKWLTIKYTLSKEKRSGFLNGRVNKEILRAFVKGKGDLKVFLVGPPPMMKSVQKDLKELGIHKNKIFTERFALK